uniref:Uncharacterized protein n=1 Tax=Vespula pensylvanica TaxID=30213 RepID=A0A834UAM0_VESPE|nr:hypothetical protein H0235_008254 [Vespula pensylvanica]
MQNKRLLLAGGDDKKRLTQIKRESFLIRNPGEARFSESWKRVRTPLLRRLNSVLVVALSGSVEFARQGVGGSMNGQD